MLRVVQRRLRSGLGIGARWNSGSSLPPLDEGLDYALAENVLREFEDSFFDRSVSVDNLAGHTTSIKLQKFFSQIAPVLIADIIRTPDGMSTGRAIVEYLKPVFASNAIDLLDGKLLHGKKLIVKKNTQRLVREIPASRHLLLSSLPRSCNADDLRILGEKWGTIESTSMELGENGARNVGSMVFQTREAAKQAYYGLYGRMLNGKIIHVKFVGAK